MVIWKWELKINDIQKLTMPKDAKILSVQEQNGKCCIWALCNENEVKEERNFIIYGTGHKVLPILMNYIGTFQLFNGDLVFHLFEIVNERIK